uniref:Phosphatidylinositol-glycan biosynthesis class X protein n=1 Tax=Glossina pallidipes TaxID=7398 RepID=A0A1A9ZAV2_GLOPL
MRIFVIVMYILLDSVQGNDLQMPTVEVEMLGSGLHRKIVYTVHFNDAMAGTCEYVLKQTLPAAMYVSTDELKDLRRLKKLNSVFPRFVDIEVPTEKANSFDVFLRGVPKIEDSAILPIHYRYHAPHRVNRFASVQLPKSIIYMNCPRNEEIILEKYTKFDSSIKYCLNFDQLTINPQTNESINDDSCNWMLLQQAYHAKSSLTANIPLGNKNACTRVLYGTIFISWFAALWSVFYIFRQLERVKYKL